MKSRIAIFEGYGAPLYANPRQGPSGGPFGAQYFQNQGARNSGGVGRYGAPLYSNPRTARGDAGLGRRSYYVPPREESMADSRRPYRKGYRVAKKRNTPAMARAQRRFKKAAKVCSRKARTGRTSFQTCMKKALRKKGKR